MPEHPRLRGLMEWSLAAFHAGFLVAGLVALLYATGGLGELLGGLNTLLGLGLFGVFWLTTWWTTRRAARGVAWVALERPVALAGLVWRVAVWAGVNGVLFVLALLGFVGVYALATILAGRGSAGDTLSVFAFSGAIALAVAFVAGAVVGLLFALIDGALLVVARWVAPAAAA